MAETPTGRGPRQRSEPRSAGRRPNASDSVVFGRNARPTARHPTRRRCHPNAVHRHSAVAAAAPRIARSTCTVFPPPASRLANNVTCNQIRHSLPRAPIRSPVFSLSTMSPPAGSPAIRQAASDSPGSVRAPTVGERGDALRGRAVVLRTEPRRRVLALRAPIPYAGASGRQAQTTGHSGWRRPEERTAHVARSQTAASHIECTYSIRELCVHARARLTYHDATRPVPRALESRSPRSWGRAERRPSPAMDPNARCTRT